MSDNGSAIEIIIFAGIAVFLLFRLRAVLGRRTGEERPRPNPLDRPPAVPLQRAGVDPAAAGVKPSVLIEQDSGAPLSLDAKLARVHAGDPNFDEKHFLAGARAAFQMIVGAFAAGDLATLRPLLSSHLYGEFGRAISERPHRDGAAQVRFEGPIEAEIRDARLVGNEVQIQVGFTSRQSHSGEDGPAVEAQDLWTFAHLAGARDPNWQVIETAIGV